MKLSYVFSVVIFSGRCEKEAYHDNSIERDEPARFSRYGMIENEDITVCGCVSPVGVFVGVAEFLQSEMGCGNVLM